MLLRPLAPVGLPLMATISAWCTRRSMIATTQLALGNTSDHSENATLVVISVLFFSWRRLINSSSRSAWRFE
jgi:hypothetical protein